jgi:H+/Na+-translocating ferredoxin:NAD+ oxidoreductase subunit G
MDAENSGTSKPSSGLKQNYLVQAWLVLVLVICFGSALAAIQMKLGPVIEANKLNETLEKVPELVFGAGEAAKLRETPDQLTVIPRQVEVKKPGKVTYYSVYEAELTGKRSGWVVKAKGQGYADTIELLIGLDADARNITGLYVLGQKETPGLGNRIVEPKWRDQFQGKSAVSPLKVIKAGTAGSDEIDSVSGATISSTSVCRIINTALADLKGKLN